MFYCCRRHKFGIKALLCNNFILLRMKLFQQYTTHCYFSIATTVMRPRRNVTLYGGADKSLARPGRKQATATEDFDDHVSYL
jgi:hypothetical protein